MLGIKEEQHLAVPATFSKGRTQHRPPSLRAELDRLGIKAYAEQLNCQDGTRPKAEGLGVLLMELVSS